MFTDDSNVGTYHSLLALVLAYFNVVTYQTTEKYSPVKWIKFFPDGWLTDEPVRPSTLRLTRTLCDFHSAICKKFGSATDVHSKI